MTVEKRWSTDQLIAGISLPKFVDILRTNRFQVEPRYLHRAAWVGALSLGTSAAVLAEARFETTIQDTDVVDPIFVLGHWRSGTTHLHNLLGRLPGHTYPTVFQCIFPECFLSTKGFLPGLTQGLFDDTRTYDNVKQGWEEAAEDEIALAKLTGMSPYVGTMFPKNIDRYERYVDFRGVDASERQVFKDALLRFLKKISVATGQKRIVVKSCAHSARIDLLLELFPNAKFVYIHRHPYEVFASTLHMRSHTDWENFFHLPQAAGPEDPVLANRIEQTLALGKRIFDRYQQDRDLIPKENLVELGYADLCGREIETIERVYRRLGLGDFEQARMVLTSYVQGLKGYKRNRLQLKDSLRQQVDQAWASAFELGGYKRSGALDGLNPSAS